jgi:hypothetical protein
MDEQEKRERNDAIASATIRWLGERGYSVAWDGEGFYVSIPRMTKDHLPLMKRHANRFDAYMEALSFAAAKYRPKTEAERVEQEIDDWMEENAG